MKLELIMMGGDEIAELNPRYTDCVTAAAEYGEECADQFYVQENFAWLVKWGIENFNATEDLK